MAPNKKKLFNSIKKNIVGSKFIGGDIIKEFCPSLEIEYVSNEIMNQHSYEVSNQKFKDTGFIFEGEMKKRIYETLSLLGKINNDEKFL